MSQYICNMLDLFLDMLHIFQTDSKTILWCVYQADCKTLIWLESQYVCDGIVNTFFQYTLLLRGDDSFLSGGLGCGPPT